MRSCPLVDLYDPKIAVLAVRARQSHGAMNARPHPFLRAPSYRFLSEIRVGVSDESHAEAFAN